LILISHRGNIEGVNSDYENNPIYVNEALNKGFYVEIDVWFIDGRWYLGHDSPQHEITSNYLKNDRFWCHAKNIDALNEMLKENIHCFWHQKDDVTLTSKGYMWTYPGKELKSNSVVVMPEEYLEKWWRYSFDNCSGICSDFIIKYKEKYDKEN
jgi:hypothetical protein